MATTQYMFWKFKFQKNININTAVELDSQIGSHTIFFLALLFTEIPELIIQNNSLYIFYFNDDVTVELCVTHNSFSICCA